MEAVSNSIRGALQLLTTFPTEGPPSPKRILRPVPDQTVRCTYSSPQAPDDQFTFGDVNGKVRKTPLVCKYDGVDAATTYDILDFRFRLRPPSAPDAPIVSGVIGQHGDVPMCADTDGDGDSEFIVFRPRDAGGAGLGPGWYNEVYGWTHPLSGTVHDYALAR